MNIAPEEMPREIERLEDENERLQDRIDKAIEIMYDKGTFNLDNEYGKVFVELLDILKGSDSNE